MTRKHPGRFHIAIPGPTNIPERILNAMHISSEDQRNPEIPELTIPLYKDVKKVFKSESGTVFLFPGSGTGASGARNVAAPLGQAECPAVRAPVFPRLGRPPARIKIAARRCTERAVGDAHTLG